MVIKYKDNWKQMGGYLQPICFFYLEGASMKNVLKDKVFLRSMIMLAVPITLQSFITSSLNLIDTMMVGSLKEAAISAVGLANQYMFVFTLCLMGINAGANVFMAQYWGKKELASVKKFLGIDLTVGFIASALFGLAAYFMPDVIMNIMSDDPEVITLGIGYLKIIAVSCLFMNFTQGYSSALRSTEETKIPMYASLVGVALNIFLNWVFIFGEFGIPALGVYGAALATSTARLIEMLFIIGAVYLGRNKVAAKLKELFDFDFSMLKNYFITSWSVIVNELVFSLGSAAYSVAYAKLGTDASATMQISSTLINMFFIFLTGIGTAAAIMIGNKIGASEEDTARTYASHVSALTPFVGIGLGVSLWFFAPVALTWFNIKPETYQAAIIVLRVMAVFMPLRSFNAIMIIGVFRGGGDTTYSMLVQAGTIWLYSVPLAFIGAMFLGWPVYKVFFLVCTEEIIKIMFELSRLKSGKWLRNLVN